VPSAYLLLIGSPSGCPAADALGWRNVWNRDYLGASRADPEATTE
jgi:hypothetical protein